MNQNIVGGAKNGTWHAQRKPQLHSHLQRGLQFERHAAGGYVAGAGGYLAAAGLDDDRKDKGKTNSAAHLLPRARLLRNRSMRGRSASQTLHG